jgi:hypothetical protein
MAVKQEFSAMNDPTLFTGVSISIEKSSGCRNVKRSLACEKGRLQNVG